MPRDNVHAVIVHLPHLTPEAVADIADALEPHVFDTYCLGCVLRVEFVPAELDAGVIAAQLEDWIARLAIDPASVALSPV